MKLNRRSALELIEDGQNIYFRKYDPEKDAFVRFATLGEELAHINFTYSKKEIFVFRKDDAFYIFYSETGYTEELFTVEPKYLLKGDKGDYLIELPVKGLGYIYLHKGVREARPFFQEKRSLIIKGNMIYFRRGSNFDEYFWLNNGEVIYEPNNY